MSSELTLTLRPEAPRTLVPITVDVTGAESGSPTIAVFRDGQEVFRLTAAPKAGGHEGSFWFARPGDYRVEAVSGSKTASRDLRVEEQRFLSFPAEFGAFFLALALAGGGLILWFRSRKKAGPSSASSSSSLSPASPSNG